MTMQDLVRGIFGEDAANDPEIVSWYEDVNKEAISEAIENGSIEFAEWAVGNNWVTKSDGSGWINAGGILFPDKGYIFPESTSQNLYKLYLQDQNKK